MIVKTSCKIELATSRDKEILSEPYFTGKELVATDGHILAVVAVDGGQNDTPGYVSKDFLKRLRAGKVSYGDAVYLSANGELSGEHRKEGLLRAERPLRDAEFPDWRSLLSGDRKEAVLALDPGLLLRLSQAIGYGHSVRLHIPLGEEGEVLSLERIRVTNNDGEADGRNYGFLMPCRMKEGKAPEGGEEDGPQEDRAEREEEP